MNDLPAPCLTVPVVKDEILARICAANFLDEAGFKVFEATDSGEALTILQARPDIHAVITDGEMPGPMNGFDLTRVVHERWPGV
jgi:CheY-like chemotaxis protein